MLRFIDDLAGAVRDVFVMILKGLSYIIAGMLIVGVPLSLIAWIFGVIEDLFY